MHDDDEGIETDSTIVYLNALLALKNGDFHKAQENLKRALKLGLSDEETEKAHLYLAEAYFRTGRDDEAIPIVEKFLHTSPTKFSGPEARGILFPYTDFYWSGHGAHLGATYGPEAALKYLKERETLLSGISGTHMPNFHYVLANTYLHLKRSSDAQKELEKCVQAEIPFPSGDPRRDSFENTKEKARQKLAGIRKSDVEGCWIASAAYGSDSLITEQLRRFRDEMLHHIPGGPKFIQVYYRTSPHIAGRMDESAALRYILRVGVVLPAYWLARLALLLRSRY